MKQWQETSRILERNAGLAKAGKRAALATVVHIEGSAYRRPGAKLLIEESGATMGGISGGCLEADVREVALTVMREGEARLRHYDTDDDNVWGLGLGCGGAVDVFIQPATSEDALAISAKVIDLLAGDTPFAVSTVIAGSTGLARSLVVGEKGLLAGSTGDAALDREVTKRCAEVLASQESALHEARSQRIFTEVHVPPPRLLVFGAGDDAMPLAAYAASVGFRVAVADHRQAYLSRERFPEATHLTRMRPEEPSDDPINGLLLGPNCFAVVMTHALTHDRAWVKRLLATPVRYIGILGPRRRTDEIMGELGVGRNERIYGPIGLDVGADGPEQIAVSVVAEILAVLAGRAPSHLRDREGAIHAG